HLVRQVQAALLRCRRREGRCGAQRREVLRLANLPSSAGCLSRHRRGGVGFAAEGLLPEPATALNAAFTRPARQIPVRTQGIRSAPRRKASQRRQPVAPAALLRGGALLAPLLLPLVLADIVDGCGVGRRAI